MRPGGGKQKGASFERLVCVDFSLWISGGKRKDLFWRSAMSGGRATISRGEVRQAGDISSVAAEGHVLTDSCYIECKHVRDLALPGFILNGTGLLARFWETALHESAKYGRLPLIIAKQNNMETLLITRTRNPFNSFYQDEDYNLEMIRVDMGCVCAIFKYEQVLALPFRRLEFDGYAKRRNQKTS